MFVSLVKEKHQDGVLLYGTTTQATNSVQDFLRYDGCSNSFVPVYIQLCQ